jgi:hypothetical protein
LYPSIYTSNVDSPPESIVLRHWQAIVGHLLPGGVISHRSAFDSRPFEGSLSITIPAIAGRVGSCREQNVNALVMQKRADRKPGEWKEKANQAGSTYFVVPELVVGSLREGFERIRALPHPLAQAIMTMFVVAEVHPFSGRNCANRSRAATPFKRICAATNCSFRPAKLAD